MGRIEDLYEKLREKGEISKKEMDAISKEIKKLDGLLQMMGDPTIKPFRISEDFYIYWDNDHKRLMCNFNRNHRPLIEQPIFCRKTAFKLWENILIHFTEHQ